MICEHCHKRLGPRELTDEELAEQERQLNELIEEAKRKFTLAKTLNSVNTNPGAPNPFVTASENK